MKQIIKELGGVVFTYDGTGGSPYPPNRYEIESQQGHWISLDYGGAPTGNWYMADKLDVSGWTVDELTLFPQSIQVQRSAYYGMKTINNTLPSTLEDHRESFIELIFITSSPIDLDLWYDNLADGSLLTISPNFATQCTSFDNVIWGNTITYVREINTPAGADYMTPFLIDDFSSWSPTNTDTLYVYRILSINASPNTSPPQPETAFLVLPTIRLVIRGNLQKEPEYANLMRMKRSYELQQTFDND